MKSSRLQCNVLRRNSVVCLDSYSYYSAHDNAKFASAGGDRSVFVWDVATATTLRRLSGHMGKVHAVEFNEDASIVASGTVNYMPKSSPPDRST